MTNWRAMQCPRDPKTKEALIPHGIKPRYMAMASFHADMSKGGKSKKAFKGCGTKEA